MFRIYTVLHLHGKKYGIGKPNKSKQQNPDKSKQQKPDKSKQQKSECECICPPQHYKILTMDDMQLPYGSWKEQYQIRNKKYNIILLFGLVSLIGSITTVSQT